MTNQDDNNQEIEKVEDVEVETTKKTSDSDDKKQNDDEYEKVCFICRRPESVAGKMIELRTTSVSAMTACRRALMQCRTDRSITVS